jgi:outer membrane protein OmpA-like peptidoglycan-associated protein
VVTLGGKIGGIHVDPVDFVPGTTELKPRSKEQLTQLAQLLKDRPKLELELRGLASSQEEEQLKRERLRRQVKNSDASYESALARLYRLANKNREGSKALPSLEAMENYLAKNVVLPKNALQHLAVERASYVEQRLIETGIEGGRLYTETAVSEDLPGRVEFAFLT